MKEPISIWQFWDAPAHLQRLSTHGGDEDWLAELPPEHRSEPQWMTDGTAFGWSLVSWHIHPTKPGWHVAIGSH